MLSQQCQYETLNKEIINAKLMAETKCRKIKTGKYGWTPELTTAIKTVLYWRGIEKQNKGRTVGKEILKRQWERQDKCKPEHFMMLETTLQNNIKQGTAYLQTVQANKERCQMWLSQLIEAQAKNKKTSKKSIWKCHIATRQQRELSRCIKAMETEDCQQGLTKVTAPTPQCQQPEGQQWAWNNWNKHAWQRQAGDSPKQKIPPSYPMF